MRSIITTFCTILILSLAAAGAYTIITKDSKKEEMTQATKEAMESTLDTLKSEQYYEFGSEKEFEQYFVTGICDRMNSISHVDIKINNIDYDKGTIDASTTVFYGYLIGAGSVTVRQTMYFDEKEMPLYDRTKVDIATEDETSNSENLAYKKNTAQSSSEVDSMNASAAVDGNDNTRWSSDKAEGDNPWMMVDLGKKYNVDKIKIVWETAYAKDYIIETSIDGNEWKTVYAKLDGEGGTEKIKFPATKCKYVKIQCLKREYEEYGCSIYELEVYSSYKTDEVFENKSNNYVLLTAAATATSSGSESGMDERYAIDNNEGTRWSSNFSDDAWMIVDLGTICNISQIKIIWEEAYATDYDILVSEDGETYKKFFSKSDGKGKTEKINFKNTTARYIKFQGIKRKLEYGYSMWEFYVYGGAVQ